MTLQEFKAWFDGFTEEMSAAPNKKQWERIKKRVKEIDGTITSYPVFIDRYPRHYWQTLGFSTCGSTLQGNSLSQYQGLLQQGINSANNMALFNSGQAMGALRKADYEDLQN